MKCPHCGHWNKPSFPRCFQCGHPLNARAERSPEWREKFREPQPKKERIVYDDTIDPVVDLIEEAPARADSPIVQKPHRRKQQAPLAQEMTELKDRRARGNMYLQEFRENAAKQGIAPSGSGVSVRRSNVFSTLPDDPEYTIQPPRGARYGADAQEDADAYAIPEAPERKKRPKERAYTAEASYADVSAYGGADNPYAMYDEDLPPAFDTQGPIAPYTKKRRARRVRGPILLAYMMVGVLILAVVGFGIYAAASYVVPTLTTQRAATEKAENVTLTKKRVDGLNVHHVEISGEEGAQIYVAEMYRSYVVVGGIAAFDVPDHVFYDMIEPLDKDVETMDVSLTPTMSRNGVETRLEPIRYTIDIPESEITVLAPEMDELAVNTSIYTIKLQLAPSSRVLVNGKDESDKVDDEGLFTHNVPVLAIGNNIVSITVRAPYCRENIKELNFYRAPMEIPLELDPATLTNTTDERLTIHGTTQVGAVITIESANFGDLVMVTDPDTGELTGKFNFGARMTRVGNNRIIIRASYEGKEDSVLEHLVYYLPNPEVYTPKAWALNASDYTELMNNISLRIQNAQIYLCYGTITEIMSSKPQLALMDTGKDGRTQLVMLQNESKTTWEVGKQYRVYADVSGVYNNMPRLMGRYTYADEVPEEDEDAKTDADTPETAEQGTQAEEAETTEE